MRKSRMLRRFFRWQSSNIAGIAENSSSPARRCAWAAVFPSEKDTIIAGTAEAKNRPGGRSLRYVRCGSDPQKRTAGAGAGLVRRRRANPRSQRASSAFSSDGWAFIISTLDSVKAVALAGPRYPWHRDVRHHNVDIRDLGLCGRHYDPCGKHPGGCGRETAHQLIRKK